MSLLYFKAFLASLVLLVVCPSSQTTLTSSALSGNWTNVALHLTKDEMESALVTFHDLFNSGHLIPNVSCSAGKKHYFNSCYQDDETRPRYTLAAGKVNRSAEWVDVAVSGAFLVQQFQGPLFFFSLFFLFSFFSLGFLRLLRCLPGMFQGKCLH